MFQQAEQQREHGEQEARMPAAVRILLAVDESDNSRRVVQYVGSLLSRTPDAVITLFHVLKPMPRRFLEHGGSENPAVEAQLSMQLRHEQDAWIQKERESDSLHLNCEPATPGLQHRTRRGRSGQLS